MQSKIPIHLHDIQGEGVHVFINTFINDQETCLLIDTGASRTIFDKSRLLRFIPSAELDLTTYNQLSMGIGTDPLKSEVFTLQSLRMGECEIKDYPAVAIDISHINQTYSSLGIPQIDGVIGGDLLYRFKAIISYRDSLLTLRFRKSRK